MPFPVSQANGTVVKTIGQYFETFNQHDFLKTAQLFSQDGRLCPPFETPVVGPSAIAAYLDREAGTMVADPQDFQIREQGEYFQEVIAKGQVQTSAFRVNVEWRFLLRYSEDNAEIQEVRIKLLASLRDLLSMRPSEDP